MMGWCLYKKRKRPEQAHSLPVRTQGEGGRPQARKRVFTDTESASTWISDFRPLEL